MLEHANLPSMRRIASSLVLQWLCASFSRVDRVARSILDEMEPLLSWVYCASTQKLQRSCIFVSVVEVVYHRNICFTFFIRASPVCEEAGSRFYAECARDWNELMSFSRVCQHALSQRA